MISIGGVGASQYFVPDTNNATADPWAQGIGVFDMTSLQWKDSYQSKADRYSPPDTIKKYYHQNASHYPSSWTSPGVRKLFDFNYHDIGVSPRLSTPPVSQHMKAGAIAGTATGCILAIFVCAVGLWLLRRHKRGNENRSAQASGVKDCHGSENELETKDFAGEMPVIESIHEFEVGRLEWELPVRERIHEFEVEGPVWELPVGTRVVRKAARGNTTEMHG